MDFVTLRRKRVDISPAALADQVQAHLSGLPISLLVSEDEHGYATVSVLPVTSNDPVQIDAETLLRLGDEHVKPPPPLDPLAELEMAVSTARTLDDVKSALGIFARKERTSRLPAPTRTNGVDSR